MQNRIVLDVRSCTDGNLADVTAQHRHGPDRNIICQDDSAGNMGLWRNKNALAQLRLQLHETVDIFIVFAGHWAGWYHLQGQIESVGQAERAACGN
jgi:hypothetical protein